MLALLTGLVIAATAPAPAPPAVDSLSWLPANTQAITGAPGAGAPPLKLLRDTIDQFATAIETKPLECWSKVTAPVVASYQIWTGWDDKEAAVLAQGHVDHAVLKACIDETFRMGRSLPRISQVGAITQIETDHFGRSYIGWTPSWIVWHSDRGRIEELLAATKRRTRSISPALATALRRSDRAASMWFGATLDYSTLFLGIPSRSFSGSVDTTTSDDPTVRVTFEYRSAADANRAAGAVTAAVANVALAPEIRALARDARSTARDRLLVLEFGGKAILGEGTMAALQAWVDKKKAELTHP